MQYQIWRDDLLQLAKQAVVYGLEYKSVLPVNLTDYPNELQQQRACFVTLNIDKQLRGCIGSLQAHQALVMDIAKNAYSAAFSDPRFPPVSKPELEQLSYHISILNPAELMTFTSQEDLLQQIRPKIDGLILQYQNFRGTFLPSVWESLTTREQFLAHLNVKAGLPADFWHDDTQIWRYTTEMIE